MNLMLFSHYYRGPLFLYLILTPEQAEITLSAHFSHVILCLYETTNCHPDSMFLLYFPAVKI